MSEYQCILTNEVDGVTVVCLIDPKVMDPSRIKLLGDELLSLAGDHGGKDRDQNINHPSKRNLLINLENVRFLSSAAINKLIILEKRVTTHGGAIKICNVSPEVREVFAITHLNNVFEILDDHTEAVKAFEQ
jgi:anti-anti-sigma regulatory factor